MPQTKEEQGLAYRNKLTIRETERAIKIVKDVFEVELANLLNLERISAPLFVRPESGLNDNLSGMEQAVSFTVADVGARAEIVHSLAKWKRFALGRYAFEVGKGLYTDMNAIRAQEQLDAIHSVYVDQWDWEKVITKEQRNEATLKETVLLIYRAMRNTQQAVCKKFPQLDAFLVPEQDFYFITSQELEDRFPNLTGGEREREICKEKQAVFIMKIGGALKSGQRHDSRAPDYDDWELNGDILIWNELLQRSFEISSMGIRVDEESMNRQLKIAHCEDRVKFPFHRAVLEKKLPYTIGGGIGQSRLCMLFLQKAHIGEVQASVWSDEMFASCAKDGIFLL